MAQSNGARYDYRNSSGNTYLSNCDEDKLVEVICEIYAGIARMTVAVDVRDNTADRTLGGTATPEYRVDILRDQRAAGASMKVILNLINSLQGASDLDPESILGPVDPGTDISLRDGEQLAAELVNAAIKLPRHRYYIKSSLKILEAISSSVLASSASISRIFDILNNSVLEKDLEGPEVQIYDMFVNNFDQFETLLQNFSPSQTNLIRAGRFIHSQPSDSDSDIFLRRDISSTRSERYALRDFIQYMMKDNHLDDMHIMTVGLPSGLLRALAEPSLSANAGDSASSIATSLATISGRSNKIRIAIDRYDEAYNLGTKVSIDVTNLGGTLSSNSEFDPEIFVLPGSIKYAPNQPDDNIDYNRDGAVDKFDEIFSSTTFYRIRDGQIVGEQRGDQIKSAEITVYANALKSYLLDLFLYDSIGMRHYDNLGPTGPIRLNQSATRLMEAVSQDPDLSGLIASRRGFINMFDTTSGELKTGANLLRGMKDRLGRRFLFTAQDIKLLGVVAAMSPMCETGDVVRYRNYDRVYHFIYDESQVREKIGDTQDIISRRKQFDIYTLVAKLVPSIPTVT